MACRNQQLRTIAIQMNKRAPYLPIHNRVKRWLTTDRIEKTYEATIILLLLLVTCTIGCMMEYFRYLPIPIYLALLVIASFTLISWHYKW